MQKGSRRGLGLSTSLIVISVSSMSKPETKIQVIHPRRPSFNISDTDNVQEDGKREGKKPSDLDKAWLLDRDSIAEAVQHLSFRFFGGRDRPVKVGGHLLW